MASYVSSSGYVNPNNVATSSLSVRAGTVALRLLKIEVTLGSGGSGSAPFNTAIPFAIYRYSGATISGGTVITSQPLRDGAAAATATSRFNGSISGTALLLHTEVNNSQFAQIAYQFASDILVAPGDAIYVSNATGVAAGNMQSIGIQYEEYHLARST